MTSAIGYSTTWSVISLRDNKEGSQLDDIEIEGRHWTGGKLQHSGLIIKGGKGSMSDKIEEDQKIDTLTLGHAKSIRRAQSHSHR